MWTSPTRPSVPKGIHPSLGSLKAFRVSERLSRALRGEIGEPQVTVTPSFDVYVQAETYPARCCPPGAVVRVVKADTSFVLKLTKQRSPPPAPRIPNWTSPPCCGVVGERAAGECRPRAVRVVRARREIRAVCEVRGVGSGPGSESRDPFTLETSVLPAYASCIRPPNCSTNWNVRN